MNHEVKLALIQFQSLLGDVESNTEKAAKMCTEAASKGANVICLPEMFSTGYNLNLIGDSLYYLSENANRKTISKLQNVAKENSCYIVAPIAMYNTSLRVLQNCAVVIDCEGGVLGIYEKTHLWMNEQLYFKPGNSFPVFSTKYGKIGVMICYDLSFPEVARILTMKGAEIILCPAAWEINSKNLWNRGLEQRAVENTVFVAGVNRVGVEGDLHLCGSSKVCNPCGEVLVTSKESIEEIIYCTLDMREILDARAKLPHLKDRKPELYKSMHD